MIAHAYSKWQTTQVTETWTKTYSSSLLQKI